MAITDINLSGKVRADDGSGVTGATVTIHETAAGLGGSQEGSADTTDSDGTWSFTETTLTETYDVKISSSGGGQIRYIPWSDEITLKTVDTSVLKVRGAASAAAPLYFFADRADDAGDAWRIQASASDTLAIGSDKASAGTIIDYITITNGANAAASTAALAGTVTVGTALNPASSDGAAMGTGSLMWSDLFLASGSVINFNNGDVTLTHSSNTLTAAGGTVATAALTTSTIVASGIIKTDDTTAATSTTDGSLQTDGGLSVALDAVIGDDVFLLSDGAVFNMGAGNDFTITHDGTTGATIAGSPITLSSTGAMYLRTSANEDMNNVLGGAWRIRDRESSEAVRLEIMSGTGEIVFSATSNGTISNASGALTLEPTTDVLVANGTGMVIGHTAQVTVGGLLDFGSSGAPELQVLGTTTGDCSMLLGMWTGTADRTGALTFFKSPRATIGGDALAVGNGEALGRINWIGDDGDDYTSIAASIQVEVDAAPGDGDMPGRMMFMTTANAAATPTERMRISSAGGVYLTEIAAADTDIAGKGQIWVKNATPNELWFTDDAGTDHQVSFE